MVGDAVPELGSLMAMGWQGPEITETRCPSSAIINKVHVVTMISPREHMGGKHRLTGCQSQEWLSHPVSRSDHFGSTRLETPLGELSIFKCSVLTFVFC